MSGSVMADDVLRFHVVGDVAALGDVVSSGEVAGMDTTILRVPDEMWVRLDEGERALNAPALGAFLRMLAHQQAAALGEKLHHAEFVMTKNPAVIEARGALHDCEECRAGVRRALRALQESPEADFVVGTLYWSRP